MTGGTVASSLSKLWCFTSHKASVVRGEVFRTSLSQCLLFLKVNPPHVKVTLISLKKVKIVHISTTPHQSNNNTNKFHISTDSTCPRFFTNISSFRLQAQSNGCQLRQRVYQRAGLLLSLTEKMRRRWVYRGPVCSSSDYRPLRSEQNVIQQRDEDKTRTRRVLKFL